MESIIYRREDGLVIDRQADDWAIIHPPGDQKGIALDPLIFAIWSVAEGHTVTDVARSVHISTYLACCALAVLQRAGLLQDGPSTTPSLPTHAETDATKFSVSALILHRHPQADLDTCVDSLLKQRDPVPIEIKVIAANPVRLEAKKARLIQRENISWTNALNEQLAQIEGEAVLLLDSQIKLTPGALSEMVRTLELQDDIAAVAPRVMWERWPRFVARVGDRSKASDLQCAPYTGHLDVGQFKRWREVSSIHSSAGLLRREALRRVKMSGEVPTPEQIVREWCHKTRLQGYHILAALRAVAHGPWPDDLTCDTTTSTLYKGLPALTVENIRGLYSHYATITPLPLQQRVSTVELQQYTSNAFEEAGEIVCGGDGDPLQSLRPVAPEPTPLRALPGKAWRILRQQGLGGIAHETHRYIRWKVGR